MGSVFISSLWYYEDNEVFFIVWKLNHRLGRKANALKTALKGEKK